MGHTGGGLQKGGAAALALLELPSAVSTFQGESRTGMTPANYFVDFKFFVTRKYDVINNDCPIISSQKYSYKLASQCDIFVE